ncbi:hypothetical protein TWF730_006943 [Orbilia blumenaviensis]|uniref:HIG1 domain-containing protein n=1 Tax=Orbilia blumenaviensis TaxID=1796055 RepID=A0AAV9VI29_9PEZI
MKILTKEEEDEHYAAVVKGGLKGGAYGLGIGLASAFLLNHRYPYFRSLTLPIKAFLVSSTATAALIITAENTSRQFEINRLKANITYQDRTAAILAENRARMSTQEKFMDWGRENRYKIVGASWIASMAGSLGLVYRDKYLSRAQKLVQARVYAQGLTLMVLLASAAFEISDARSGKRRDIIMVPDPTDPTGQKMIEKKVHHEQYEGQDLWMDMVKGEEERIKRRKEEAARESPKQEAK